MNEHEQVMGVVSGKNQSPIDLDPVRTTLIVVDMQRYFTEPSHPLLQVLEAMSPGVTKGYNERVRTTVLPNTKKLLAAFRAAGAPVVFTATGTETGDGKDLPFWLRSFDDLGMSVLGSRVYPDTDDPSYEIDSELNPQKGEVLVNKRSAGAFATTGLEQQLKNLEIETVVISGVTSDVCVASTAREAADRGFKTILVSDACTTLSEEMHRASLETFNIAFGWTRTSDEVVQLMAGKAGAADK